MSGLNYLLDLLTFQPTLFLVRGFLVAACRTERNSSPGLGRVRRATVIWCVQLEAIRPSLVSLDITHQSYKRVVGVVNIPSSSCSRRATEASNDVFSETRKAIVC
jgi:hypothetical protein